MNTLVAVAPSGVSLSMKNTRSRPEDSRNSPGVTRSMSLRCSYCWRMPMVCELAQGQPTSAMAAMSSSTGQAKRNSGWTKSARPRPLENQITISLSRYMRESVPTMAMNRLRLRMVGM
ncbi:hypothetical protein D3C72_1717180 [compost metagenome]